MAVNTGYKFPTATGTPNNTWTTPEKAFATDNDPTYPGSGTYQNYSNFNFNIPSDAAVRYFYVRFRAFTDNVEPSKNPATIRMAISKNGGSSYSAYANINVNTSSYSYTSVYASNVFSNLGDSYSNANFNIRLQNLTPSFYLDSLEVIVYYDYKVWEVSALGSIKFSSIITITSEQNATINGALTFGGNLLAIQVTNPTKIETKTYLYKVYDRDNNFVGVWDDVVGIPNLKQEINTTGSSMQVTLARNADSLATSTVPLQDNLGNNITDNNGFPILTTINTRYQVAGGSTVQHDYRVKRYVFYGEQSAIQDNNGQSILDSDSSEILGTIGAPNGYIDFDGFIDDITINYGSDENTVVTLISYGFDLDQYVLNSSGTTTVAYNSTKPSDMIKQSLDVFAADGGSDVLTTYSASTIEDTGTTTSYTFKVNTYKEVLEKALQLSPEGFYYYVGLGNNLVYYKSKTILPKHTFYLGKHITALSLKSYISDSTNEVLYTGGGDPALLFKRTITPATGTRRRLERLNDGRVTLESSAELIATNTIDNKNKIQYNTSVTVSDKVYDIESILTGDLVGFRNFDNNVDTLTMQVVSTDKQGDLIVLQLDTLPVSPTKRLEELRRNLVLKNNDNAQDTPST